MKDMLVPQVVYGYFAVNADGDDLVVYTDDTRSQVALTWHGLRQQTEKPEYTDEHGQTRLRPSRCLADFVAPGGRDHVGAFAVTTGIGADKKDAQFLAAHDDYSSIMLKALADRFAEAFAELLHALTRWVFAEATV